MLLFTHGVIDLHIAEVKYYNDYLDIQSCGRGHTFLSWGSFCNALGTTYADLQQKSHPLRAGECLNLFVVVNLCSV